MTGDNNRYNFDNCRMALSLDNLYLRMGNQYMQFPHLFGKDHATHYLLPVYDNESSRYRISCFVVYPNGKKELDCQTRLYSASVVNQFIADVAEHSPLIGGELIDDEG